MREVTSKDGLGAGIIGLGIMYAIYPWASSEWQETQPLVCCQGYAWLQVYSQYFVG